MQSELILSAILFLSVATIQIINGKEQTQGKSSVKKFQELNRCSENVQSHFVIPETLKYPYYSAKKLQRLAGIIKAPLFEFELSVKELPCKNGTFNVRVYIANNGTITSVEGKNEQVFLNFTADGSVNKLVILEDEDFLEKEILYHKDNFCIDSISNESISVNFCKSKCYVDDKELGDNLCVPRCCALGAISSGEGGNVSGCVSTDGHEWSPEIFEDSESHAQLMVNDEYTIQFWNCTGDRYATRILDSSELRILSDGKVMLEKQGDWGAEWEEIFPGDMPYRFCVDGYWDQLKSKDYVKDSSMILRRCAPKEAEDRTEQLQAAVLKTKIHIFLVHIPCALIYLLVIVIYLAIWDKHRAHGWTVLGFATNQFFLYVSLISFLSGFVFGDFAKYVATSLNGVCVLFGILHHFLSISTYSWTVVLSYDMWTTLSSIRPESSRSMGKLLMTYVGFALGVPVFIVFVVAVTLEFVPETGYVIMPGYHKSCVVPGGKPYLFYIGVVNIILYTANLVFAGLTFKSLWEASKMASKLTTSKKEATFGDKAALMTKLLLVMGASLIFEFILNFGELTKYSQFFSILEAFRLLQALGLFWTFAWGPRTQKHIREKFPELYKKAFAWRKNPTEEISSAMTMNTRSSS
ncbi:unnamed protein product [Allacma fusca]|uniref:Uncharacterized protein n=1 Tax=Allacma fusca TaxID=39272 RepID=A0A8J2PVT1_9HEXA|nr:unnamed protein product [Allacma fusca]